MRGLGTAKTIAQTTAKATGSMRIARRKEIKRHSEGRNRHIVETPV
jgi:hypothetical protein